MEIVRSELAPNANTAKAALPHGANPERHVSISQGIPPLGGFLMIFRLVQLVYKTQRQGPITITVFYNLNSLDDEILTFLYFEIFLKPTVLPTPTLSE